MIWDLEHSLQIHYIWLKFLAHLLILVWIYLLDWHKVMATSCLCTESLKTQCGSPKSVWLDCDWLLSSGNLASPLLVSVESWSEWSNWSMCGASGIQVRARQCILLFPVGSQCSGNTTESRPCVFDSNFIPGKGGDVYQCEQSHSNIQRGNDPLGQSFICSLRLSLLNWKWFCLLFWFQGNWNINSHVTADLDWNLAQCLI